ncbi:MAG: GTPase Era [Peptococcaceae bacterium]|jgi:GTP-binding protein Era|nr:GTPase Era [Peptococcaceae bacterium]
MGHRSGFAALIGRPNAGKSTLLNYLIGQKIAIVTDKAQTTRNRIVGILSHEEWQLVFIDTPGIYKPKDMLGRKMVETAMNALNEADLVYYLVDAAKEYGAGEAFIIKRLKEAKVPVFLLLNKVDALKREELLPMIDFFRGLADFKAIVPISALTGENVDALLEETLSCLPEGPRYYPGDSVTDQPERVIAAELIREKAMTAARDEVPYSVAVLVEQMTTRENGLVDIYAVLFVERESQKGILIGKKGGMLKQIGVQSRQEIESLLGTRVNLQLRVKLREGWRNNEGQLRNLELV